MTVPDNSTLKVGTMLVKWEPIELTSATFLSDQIPTMMLKNIVLINRLF